MRLANETRKHYNPEPLVETKVGTPPSSAVVLLKPRWVGLGRMTKQVGEQSSLELMSGVWLVWHPVFCSFICSRCSDVCFRKQYDLWVVPTCCSEVRSKPFLLQVCKTCQVEKPAKDFYRNRTNADGLFGKCKACSDAQAEANRKPRLRYNVSEPTVDHKVCFLFQCVEQNRDEKTSTL